ncbi:MAG: hypothetical protein R3301_11920 [Saprospiraceae bacterium]|nr:hypothetical protein [Saprospiraceae bacterium]
MNQQEHPIHLAKTPLRAPVGNVNAGLVRIGSDDFYRIEHVHLMRPFLMSLVSHSDHWAFISSNGGMTAGRRNEDAALLPYYTDDKLIQGAGHSGGLTVVRVEKEGRHYLWEPMSDRYSGVYQTQRHLYKSILGNHLIFEEINEDLGLRWRCAWQVSGRFGFIRTSHIENLSDQHIEVRILDGIQNIVPAGLSADLQNKRSNLANAYKRSELHVPTGLGMFALSAMIVDRAEPSEALRATIAWANGLTPEAVLLSTRQVDTFRRHGIVTTETDVKAEPGAYLIAATLTLSSREENSWTIGADVTQDHAAIADIIQRLEDPDQLKRDVIADLREGTEELKTLVGMADGLQCSADAIMTARHLSNVLFNIMRGGIFEDQYRVDRDDLLAHFETANRRIHQQALPWLRGLPGTLEYQKLVEQVAQQKDPDVTRLVYEYLPLSFSRRHGDPSRPWNKFSIEGKGTDGRRRKYYEGNWRDIFQNWEALAVSFPEYLPAMISRFVNASTIDGYNPYRITRDGIDWEIIEPDDPWSYIGYWGDHQIIYLLKLLELAVDHDPDGVRQLLEAKHFVYANVPYRIKGYDAIVADPQDTIDFDHKLAGIIEERVAAVGADGKLVHDEHGQLVRVTLNEKLLLTLLTKVSNFAPDAGIWLNTQRPEWNDANNALVGNGVSMVTLYYLYRYVTFLRRLLGRDGAVYLTRPVGKFLHNTVAVLTEHASLVENGFDESTRRQLVEALGRNGEHYRNTVYTEPEGQTTEVGMAAIQTLLEQCAQYFAATIAHNQRADGLYHAYNLIRFTDEGIAVDHLYEMLEGQVAILSAGILTPDDAVTLLDKLRNSAMYRADQASYMLYPNRELPGFLQKNRIPAAFADQSPLVQRMLAAGDHRVITRDVAGDYHFNGDFHNATDLQQALQKVSQAYPELVAQEKNRLLQIFEEVFDHSAFTGRSGTFFGYEGLGSIYWHMVSKLLVAVQENIRWAPGEHPALPRLVEHYNEIREGIGMHKSPEVYGAFPTDPYSHTPWGKGVQQPGMTGQVKEDILSRWAELGVTVDQGIISFAPSFLDPDEYLKEPATFTYYDLHGDERHLSLVSGQLAFTYCQVPIVYEQADVPEIRAEMSDGRTLRMEGTSQLTGNLSGEIFRRTGKVVRLTVACPRNHG